MPMSMSKTLLLWLAWRQLRASTRFSLNVMIRISILGITIGVAALVIVLSVMGGFERDLKRSMFKGLPHLEILSSNPGVGISLKEKPLQYFNKLLPEAAIIEPFIRADVILRHKKNLAPLNLFGINAELGGKLWGFSQGVLQGEITKLLSNSTEPTIIIGQELAIQLQVDYGDYVTILNPQSDVGDVLSAITPSVKFRVVGFFMTGLPNYDLRYAVVNLEYARKFLIEYDLSLDEDQYVTGIAINTAKPEDINFLATKILDKELKTVTWQQTNSSLLFALKLEKISMSLILLLIVIVAAFSISGTMMMTVFHKQGYIALLRSLGVSSNGINWLFMCQGFFIGLSGVILGILCGLVICMLLYYFQLVDLPAGIYYQQKLPVKFLPLEYLLICVSSLLLSLVASMYPALLASRQDPGNGLRYM